MNLPIFGQRDSRWESKLLGYNTSPTYTLGLYGCLVTSFAMYLKAIGKDETPDTVNEKLKANNGFVNGGNLIWSAIEKVYGIKLVYQSPYYDGPVTSQGKVKMKSLIDERRPLICHVDFDPNDPDDDMHWVLVTDYDENGNFYCNDPWTGTHVNIDVYGGSVERAVIEFRAYDPSIPIGDSSVMVPVDSKTFENLVRKSTGWDKVVQKLSVQDSETIVLAELDKLISYEDAIGQKDKALNEAQVQVSDLQGKFQEANIQLGLLQEKVDSLQKQVTQAVSTNDSLSRSIQDLKNQLQRPAFQGWKLKIYNFLLK